MSRLLRINGLTESAAITARANTSRDTNDGFNFMRMAVREAASTGQGFGIYTPGAVEYTDLLWSINSRWDDEQED